MCGQATNYSADQVLSKFIYLIPNQQTSITTFNNHHSFRAKCKHVEMNLEKKIPLHHLGKKEESSNSDKPQSICPIILIEWQKDSLLSSMRLSLLKAVEGTTTYRTPGLGHGPTSGGTYACHGYTPKICGGGNPSG